MSQTVNDITNIDDSTVSDFHSISAIEYVGFTSQNMSDFERIITAYTNSLRPKLWWLSVIAYVTI